MLSRFLRPPEEPMGAVPEGTRLYAIGDIHGRADLLDAMARLIDRDMAGGTWTEATTILLGDYIDRGPASAAVVERLARADFPTPIIALRGNHDDIFAGFLNGAVDLFAYMSIGGEATLRSYGIDPRRFARQPPSQQVAALASAIPDGHRAFLDGLPLTMTYGDYFFCHAGVRPGVALARQTSEDLLWIREEFLQSRVDFGKIVIHGHTPVRRPLVRRNGIDIDTKAFESGILTAIVLEGDQRRFLQTG